MEKEDDFLENLNQLVRSLEEAEIKLKESYRKKDADKFNKSKRLIIQIQTKISEVVK